MDEQKRLLIELETILADFDNNYNKNDIRGRILSLVPAFDTIRDLGKSIIPDGNNISARNRLLKYFLAYPRVILNEKELAIVAGISEWVEMFWLRGRRPDLRPTGEDNIISKL